MSLKSSQNLSEAPDGGNGSKSSDYIPNNPGQQNKWNLPAGLKGPRGEGRSHEAHGVGVCDGSECLFCQVGSGSCLLCALPWEWAGPQKIMHNLRFVSYVKLMVPR